MLCRMVSESQEPSGARVIATALFFPERTPRGARGGATPHAQRLRRVAETGRIESGRPRERTAFYPLRSHSKTKEEGGEVMAVRSRGNLLRAWAASPRVREATTAESAPWAAVTHPTDRRCTD